MNFIRAATLAGQSRNEISFGSSQDEKYLQPILKEDALLYSLDDIFTFEEPPEAVSSSKNNSSEVDELQRRLNEVTSQFAEYRKEVNQSFYDRLENAESEQKFDKHAKSSARSTFESTAPNSEANGSEPHSDDYETSYFSSYSYNGQCLSLLYYCFRFFSYRKGDKCLSICIQEFEKTLSLQQSHVKASIFGSADSKQVSMKRC